MICDWVLNLCVPKMRLADVSYNTDQILRLLDQLSNTSDRKQVCLFPQLALSGKTCGDLFFQPILSQACLKALKNLENALKGSKVTILIGLPFELEGRLYDTAAIINADGLQGFVLNENPDLRYFSLPDSETPGDFDWLGRQVEIFTHGDLPSGLIGEERAQVIIGKLPESKNFNQDGLVLNLTALPSLADMPDQAEIKQFSNGCNCPLALCSSGPNESSGEELYSGLCQLWQNGQVLAEDDELTMEGKVLQCDLEKLPQQSTRKPVSFERELRLPYLLKEKQKEQLERIFEIQTLGLIRRMLHSHAETLLLGISGGADSSMAMLVCHNALTQLGLDSDKFIAVSMPGPGSSEKTKQATTDLSSLIGITPRLIPIEKALEQHLQDIGHDGKTADISYENAQARERTQILMDLANMHNGLVVGTGDMSEIALGWSTYNGDQMSMYNVNAGLPKTILVKVMVWAAEMLFGEEGKQVAEAIANAPFSPELKPLAQNGQTSQTTENELGPYLLHDFFLWHAIQEGKTPRQVFEEASQIFDSEYEKAFILKTLQSFYQRFFRHQFKRTASPDGPRLFSLSLSPRSGWRMPADASPNLWLADLAEIEKELTAEETN
ncbi:MAG: NAD(+) synthase [Anaerolineaceae bacterium]|nr:NAD(+) synthase [Anaerolineaceae bacterium]